MFRNIKMLIRFWKKYFIEYDFEIIHLQIVFLFTFAFNFYFTLVSFRLSWTFHCVSCDACTNAWTGRNSLIRQDKKLDRRVLALSPDARRRPSLFDGGGEGRGG